MPEITTATNCEYPIRRTGWGLYHYFMIGIASACAFAQATAFTSIPFAIPLAICDITSSDKLITTVDVCYTCGVAFGGFFITSISDITGRKCMIPLSLMMIFGSTFACGFAHGPGMILACVFILGSGIAANTNCVKIHLAEILPSEKRGFGLAFPDLFWGIGYITSAMVAWLLTPSIVRNQKFDMRLATWRLIFGLNGSFSIMVACASALMKPSPRFLIFSRKYPEALDTLKHIYAINNSKHCETYSMRQEDLIGCVDDFSLNNEHGPGNCTEQIIMGFKRQKRLISHLLKKRFLCLTAILIFMKFAVVFGLLAINIWLAKILENGNKSNCYFTAVDILHLEENSNKCKFNVSAELYKNFFFIAAHILIGQVLVLILIDKIGRRLSIICGCIACGGSSFALGYIRNIYTVQLLTSAVFMMAYSLVDSVLNIVVIEVYPTAFRGTATGGTQFFAKLASAFIKNFLQTPCQYSFIFMGALMLAAAVLCYFLPELRGQAMVE